MFANVVARSEQRIGTYQIIDLDLTKYDKLATRFAGEAADSQAFLKSGIDTKNKKFNALIEQIERVSIRSRDPILLSGPTGAGKSNLARNICHSQFVLWIAITMHKDNGD